MNLEISTEPLRLILFGYGGAIEAGNVAASGKRSKQRSGDCGALRVARLQIRNGRRKTPV